VENIGTQFGVQGSNDPNSIGVEFESNTADNVVNGNIHVIGYRTGLKDRGGNNQLGKHPSWTGLNMGYHACAADLGGFNFYIERIMCDSVCEAPGTAAYGVKVSHVGRIGEITSTIGTSNAVQDNQVTLLSCTYTGTLGNVHVSSIISVGNASYKHANVVSATDSTKLKISAISTDNNYYTLGYSVPDTVSIQSTLSSATANLTSLQSTVDGLSSIVPGSPWTPALYEQSRLVAWFDAKRNVAFDSSNFVTTWTSRSGSLVAQHATASGVTSTQPSYSATGWDGVLPAVIFD